MVSWIFVDLQRFKHIIYIYMNIYIYMYIHIYIYIHIINACWIYVGIVVDLCGLIVFPHQLTCCWATWCRNGPCKADLARQRRSRSRCGVSPNHPFEMWIFHQTYIYIYIRIYIYVYVYVYTDLHVYIHIYTYIHIIWFKYYIFYIITNTMLIYI